MKNKTFLSVLLLVLALMVLTACNRNESEPIVLKPQIYLTVGDIVQLETRKLPEEVTVAWDVDDPTVASVSENGLVEALKAGQAVVTINVNGKSDLITLNVNPAPVVEKPESPVIFDIMTAEYLDSLPSINYSEFDDYMNTKWNIGWDQATEEATASKVDFAGTATLEDKIWRIGGIKEGAAAENGHWCVGMIVTNGYDLTVAPEGSDMYIYNKIDVPANVTQFRIWMSSNDDPWVSGNGKFRVTALYKDLSGNWNKTILRVTDGIKPDAGESITYTKDGYVDFTGTTAMVPNGCSDPNGMFIYDTSAVRGVDGVVIIIEVDGTINTLGDEASEAAGGAPVGKNKSDRVLIKRIMFL